MNFLRTAVPLKYNFIFTRMISRGTMRKNYTPSTLCGCVDHVYPWHVMYTSRGTTLMEAHAWKVHA